MPSLQPTGYLDDWIPLEWDSEVIQRVMANSAVEAVAQRHVMHTATKRVLRSSGLSVTDGKQYSTDNSDLDYIVLTAKRFMARVAVDEEDLADASMIVDVLGQRGSEWAISYANIFDNACLAVTAAPATTGVPFTSVYRSIRTTNSATSYTADANLVSWNGTASAAYDKFSETLRLVEVGKYWDPARSLLIAHPSYRDAFRRTKDNNGMPIFVQGVAGTPDTLFGVEIFWSRGNRTSLTMTQNPTGNALLIFCGDRSLLKLGIRSGPETRVDVSRAHDDFDDTAVKFRTRRGFQIGHEAAFAVLENTSGS
jgi:HK97 family phage major capsid protein